MKFFSLIPFLATAVSASVIPEHVTTASHSHSIAKRDCRRNIAKRNYVGNPHHEEMADPKNGKPCRDVQIIWIASEKFIHNIDPWNEEGIRNVDDAGQMVADKIGAKLGFDNIYLYGITWSGNTMFDAKTMDHLYKAVNRTAETCPDTKMVLGGYDYGATLLFAARVHAKNGKGWSKKGWANVPALVLFRDVSNPNVHPGWTIPEPWEPLNLVRFKWLCQFDKSFPCEGHLERSTKIAANFAVDKIGSWRNGEVGPLFNPRGGY